MKLLKNIAYFIGKILGFIGLVFVLYKLSQEYTLDSFTDKVFKIKSILFYLFGLNLLSLILGIYAWHIMLQNYSNKIFPYIISYYYFGKTEIAKYLPGNIFHFIGRQILAKKLGVSQKDMMKISIYFSFLLLVSTIISATIFSYFADGLKTYWFILLFSLCIIIVIFTFFLYPSFNIKNKLIMNILLVVSVSLQGIMLGIIVLYQSSDTTSGFFFLIVSIYIISWLIGFVTPGASGGLGVREGAFIAIVSYLHLNISRDIFLFSILLLRFINIITDVFTYLSAYIISNKIKDVNI